MRKQLILFLFFAFLSCFPLSIESYASTHAYISNNGDGTVSVIGTSDNTVTATISVGGEPLGVAVSPDGEYVYVANNGDGTVSVISTVFNTAVTTIEVGNGPWGISASPFGGYVYTTNKSDGTVSVINASEVTATVAVGSEPLGVAVSPDSEYVYVANNGDGTVSVIGTSDNTVTATISVGCEPLGVAVSPDSEYVYVANNGDGTVSVIGTSDNTVTATVAVGNLPASPGLFVGGKTPFAPSGLEATTLSDTQISLVWNDNSTDEYGFKIERKQGSTGTFSQIHTTDEDVTAYNDSGLDPYRTYYYRVIAYNGAGNSPCSSEAYATTEKEKKKGCFIATAAFGSPLEPHVKLLRKFRDRVLLDSSIGRSFVNIYYKYSPPLADFIARYDILRFMVRWGLIPIIALSWFSLNTPATLPIGLIVLLLISPAVILSIKKKWAVSERPKKIMK